MGIILLDNSNTIFNSYLQGWEVSLRLFEEEMNTRHIKSRVARHKKRN